MEPQTALGRWVRRALLAAFLVFGGYPLVWTALNSLRPTAAINDAPWALPAAPTLANYGKVLGARFDAPDRPWHGQRQFPRYYLNSLVVTAVSVFLVVALAAPAAFALARLRFRGAGWLFTLFLVGMMVPVHVTLVPVLLLHGWLGTSESLAALVLTYAAFGLPLSVLLLYGFFREIPGELLDAAQADGAGTVQLFWHVVLPLARPALAAVVILNAVAAWNEFIFARTLLFNAPHLMTLPYGLTEFTRASEFMRDIGALAAALVLSALPLLALYAVFQRRIIAGLAAGALKG